MKTILKIIAVAAITLPVLGCNEAKNNSAPRQHSSQNSAGSNAGGHSRVHGAPGPIVGAAGLPVFVVGYGVYWLIRRRRGL